jgi:uncharacterized membrane protein
VTAATDPAESIDPAEATDPPEGTQTQSRGLYGAAMTLLAVFGGVIAGYLLTARVLGEAPACGPVHGCDTVAASQYATVLGVPVALFGVVFSVVLTAACLVWWRRADRRALYAAYGLGLAGVAAVAYLTYLELFVIEAVCIWCATFAATVVAGWIVALLAARRAD